MRTLCSVLAAVGFALLLAGDAPGQRGVVPRPPPPPPVRPPVRPFVPPVVPLVPHIQPPGPGIKRPRIDPALAQQQKLARQRTHLKNLAVAAAGTIGLLPAPDGDGALLAAAMLVGREASRTPAPKSTPPDTSHLTDLAVVAAGTAGLIPAAAGHGPLLASSALVGRETTRHGGPNLAPPLIGGGMPPVPQPPAPPAANLIVWAIVPIVGLCVLVVGIAVVAGRVVMAGRGRVRIVGMPPGAAPDYIRRAWIGLELPLAPGQSGPVRMATQGVVSGERDGAMEGYVVMGSEAVKLLAAHDSEAALWWRTHAPHVLARDYQLVFPTEVCDRV